jgi:hypothetical protein
VHTFRCSDGTVIHYNSNLDGDVVLSPAAALAGQPIPEIRVWGRALIEFVARCYVAPARAREIEGAAPDQILGVKR